ncbi:phytanoyl-CoA dioxygenase [Sphingomonas lenta]|uniref:Phytanoyl-CoA dioxygenase n=1 Tax=Sphingomonas lenta TaxID=1141887 RepID=A0A2A2SDS4_9SPHN|nr:phytanoyl-CoA dioxygenase [Sphingomonas lenta]
MSFDRHGAARHDRAALSVLGDLERVLASCPTDRAGTRLYGVPGLATLLASDGPIGRIAVDRAGPETRPVRAILFDKTPGANWSLGWHQDRTIAVRERHDVPGYGPWSRKAGVQHVEPPFAVIEAMVTLRVHLDDVPADNAPLLVAPGSHKLGRLAEPNIAGVVERCGTAVCLAERGDVWAYATSIIHASAASTGHAHRRVLQVDYAPDVLAPPLEWLGV